MERLDYRINEDGLERRASYQMVLNILGFIYPALWEDIEQKMRFDRTPFEYKWGNKFIRIEYKGPSPIDRRIGSESGCDHE